MVHSTPTRREVIERKFLATLDDEATMPDWVIVGCEQLAGHKQGRGADQYAQNARSLIEQCQAAEVPVFHKQMPIDGLVSGDPNDWPEWARLRQYPEVRG